MKKLALILSTKPEDGGQHQYSMLVAECLWEKAGVDYELIVLCGNSFWRKWCKEKKIKYCGYMLPNFSYSEKQFNRKYPNLARIYYTYMTSFGETIRKEKVDILFSTRQGDFIPNYNVKLISPVHDLMHRYEPNFPEVRDSFSEREIYMKSFAKYANCILVDSKLGKKQFEESYLRGKRNKPYIVSLPFVVPEQVWKVAEEYIEVPEKYVFYPAQFWQHKNHINLVKAINLLKENISDIHLILVGSEKNNCKTIKKYIKNNNLESNITILGFVSDGNITYLYKHAVGMIMPSYFGPTNIPPLEAMALGCPVAVSNKYAMPEQVGNAGFLFNPDSPEEIAKCIERMWMDEKLCEKMRKMGLARVQRWTKKEFGDKLYQIISVI